MSPILFDQMTIVGVGLIGGSLAAAARERGLVRRVTGVGRTPKNLETALGRNLIDAFATEPEQAVSDADLVVLAGPVGTFVDTVRRIRNVLKAGAILTDVGSVKGPLVREIETLLPEGTFYVGAHPIAGGAVSGASHARADLFFGMKCVLTPTGRTSETALERLEEFWRALGSQPVRMEPDEHDRVFAYVSHLPHLVTYALIDCVAQQNGHVQNAGKGLIDTTRIAASPPEIWTDIFRLNRRYVLEAVDSFQRVLDRMKAALETYNESVLKEMLVKAKEVRDRLGES